MNDRDEIADRPPIAARLPEAPGQQHLFDSDVTPPVSNLPTEQEPSGESPPRRRRKGRGRKEIPDHLPRQDVLHGVTPEEQVCSCGCAKTQIGEDVTEQLDYIPGKRFFSRESSDLRCRRVSAPKRSGERLGTGRGHS